MPWETAKQLRGRLLAADLYPLEDYFALQGTNRPFTSAQETAFSNRCRREKNQ
jgi:hypothetical protein